jgi:hypothetical protein
MISGWLLPPFARIGLATRILGLLTDIPTPVVCRDSSAPGNESREDTLKTEFRLRADGKLGIDILLNGRISDGGWTWTVVCDGSSEVGKATREECARDKIMVMSKTFSVHEDQYTNLGPRTPSSGEEFSLRPILTGINGNDVWICLKLQGCLCQICFRHHIISNTHFSGYWDR